MPIERRYSAGSIIYFEHERGDSIYVLKSGRIDLSFKQPETGEKITKTLNQGEFFGLKSAIINHTREERAEAVTDAIAIEFKVPEFENYVSTNVELMKRLLKVLSNQLRNYGIKVNNYLGNNVLYPPNIGLFKIGEYYMNNKQYKQAIQVYQRYIEQYPNTNIVQEAKYRISILEEAIKTGFLKNFKPIDKIIEEETSGNITMDNVSLNKPLDIQTSGENLHSKLGLKESMDKYYKAEAFYNGKDFVNAEKEFKNLFNTNIENLNPEMKNKAKLMYIEVLFNLKKFQECNKEIQDFIKDCKDPTYVKKSLFVLANIFNVTGNKDNEKAILQKIVSMPPIDDLSKKAREKLLSLG